jgi:GxxExxY protein
VYKTCLAYRLQKRGLLLETEKSVPVFFEEVKMDCGYRADILVEKKVIVETKSIEGIGPPAGGASFNLSSLFGIEVWFDSEF